MSKKSFVKIILAASLTSFLTTIFVLWLASHSFEIKLTFLPLKPKQPEVSEIVSSKISEPCENEKKRLCDGLAGDAQQACLLENIDKVTSRCSQSLKSAIDMWAPCRLDLDQFCPDIKPGAMRIVTCLKNNENKLSSQCRELFNERKQRK